VLSKIIGSLRVDQIAAGPADSRACREGRSHDYPCGREADEVPFGLVGDRHVGLCGGAADVWLDRAAEGTERDRDAVRVIARRSDLLRCACE
jgi:hypothetical protein